MARQPANLDGYRWRLIYHRSAKTAVWANLSLLLRSIRLGGCWWEDRDLPWVLVSRGSGAKPKESRARIRSPLGAMGRSAVFNSVI